MVPFLSLCLRKAPYILSYLLLPILDLARVTWARPELHSGRSELEVSVRADRTLGLACLAHCCGGVVACSIGYFQ